MMLLSISRNILGQKCDGFVTFDKITGHTLKNIPQLPLYTSVGNAITAECNNRCRSSDTCSAFIINYDSHTCFKLELNSKGRRNNLVNLETKINYYEKVCLNSGGCEKAWVFERIPGYELAGYDDELSEGIKDRIQCQELCLSRKGLPCRSAEYNYQLKICRLSKETRRTQPAAYRASIEDIDYLENQCIPDSDTNQNCQYQESPETSLGFPDIQVKAATKEECEIRCDRTTAFNCRSYTWFPERLECFVSGDDTLSAGPNSLVPTLDAIYYQKSPCIDLSLVCTEQSMIVTLITEEGFGGKLFALDHPKDCLSRGIGRTETTLTFDYKDDKSRCGIQRKERGVFYNTIVVQHHPVIQQKGDRAVTLYCFFETGEKVVSDKYSITTSTANSSSPGKVTAIPSSVLNGTASTPIVELRIVDAQGLDVSGTRLGQSLFLRIELRGNSIFDIFARNLRAKSGVDDEEILLIDDRGCPTDPIFQGLFKDNDTDVLSGKFEAFKFSDTSIVNFQVNVQFCEDQCNPIDCEGGFKSYGKKRRRRRSEGHKASLRTSYRRLIYDDNLKQDVLIEDAPLRKQIFVNTGTTVANLKHSRLDVGKTGVFVEGEYSENNVICTTWTVIIGVSSSIVFLQFCVLLVCLLCIYSSHRSKYSDNEETITLSEDRSSRFTGSSTNTLYRSYTQDQKGDQILLPYLMENSEKTLKSLRTSLRD